MAYSHYDRGGDSYRPQNRRDDGPPPPPPSMFQFRGAANGRDRNDRNHSDSRNGFTFRSKPKISERPLLRTRQGSLEEQVLFNTNVADGDKFRNLDELTDSDEAEMEDSDNDDGNERFTKRARFETAQEDEKPKWSNPDVYTSLPAPSETTGKRLDFVKLIRKARNANAKSSDLAGNDEDFISFNNMDDDDAPPADAPTGPRAQDTDRTLGKRKRGDDTGVKSNARRGARNYQDGMILDEWRARNGVHPVPWVRLHQDESAGLALHKEIIDFYEWVRPRDYETDVRAGVIDRVSQTLNKIEPGELKAFGSYAAGLYLPTGDMDLVYFPRGYNQRKGFSYNGIGSNQFRKYGDYIKRSGIAQSGSVLLIPKAKVPIIKFVERISGLKVDLCFNNDTGIVAIDTFKSWKEQHPAMPVLVSIIKQFLMIRGLNDVSIGGLGGFSTICLVTSILQFMPHNNAARNLGEILLEFFNIYGNLFDRFNVGIRLDPPCYIEKKYSPFSLDKPGRLIIVDPNRADNNISGGTHEIQTILACFSRAHEVLQNRLADYGEHDHSTGHAFSFLEDLVGGDFGAYQKQRDILYQLHYGRAAPAPSVIPPPPPPITREPLPPPPPPAPAPESRQVKAKKRKGGRAEREEPLTQEPRTKKVTKAEKRATRLKQLRPELKPLIGKSISLKEAVECGGYRDPDELDKDLTRRERELEVN